MGNDKEKEGERGGRGVGKVGKKGLVDVSGGSSSGGRIRLVIYPPLPRCQCIKLRPRRFTRCRWWVERCLAVGSIG